MTDTFDTGSDCSEHSIEMSKVKIEPGEGIATDTTSRFTLKSDRHSSVNGDGTDHCSRTTRRRSSMDNLSSNETSNDRTSTNGAPDGASLAASFNLVESLGLNSLLSNSNRLTLADIMMREKRCRKFEREANELKDVICSMSHIVHILENIKRVSRDYIQTLYELIGTTIRQEHDNIEQLRQEILELETELKQWERKHHVISTFNTSNGSLGSLGVTNPFTAFGDANSSLAVAANLAMANGILSQRSHYNGSRASSEHHVDNNEDLINEQESHGDTTAESQQTEFDKQTSKVLLPPELCEMSMETLDNDEGTSALHQRQAAAAAAAAAAALFMNNHHQQSNTASAASSPLIAAAVAAAATAASSESALHKQLNLLAKQSSKSAVTPMSVSDSGTTPQSLPRVLNGHLSNGPASGINGGGGGGNSSGGGGNKPVFVCDHPNCLYQTNMRQRLAMHKRAHAGEMLYSCDIPGCGYQSNYKGNIKIHKKHRHRIECGGEQSSYLVSDLNGNVTAQKFRTRGRKRKSAQSTSETTTSTVSITTAGTNGQRGSSSKQRSSVIVGKSEDNNNDSLAINDHFVSDESGLKESTCDLFTAVNEPASGREGGDQPMYECNVDGCTYRSRWKQCLTAHQFLHAGVKPYKCDYPGCNYRTNFKGNVNVHKRVHRASEYQCKHSDCKFSTPWKNSFIIHQRNHQSIPDGDAGDETEDQYSLRNSLIEPNIDQNDESNSPSIMQTRSSAAASARNISVKVEESKPVPVQMANTSSSHGSSSSSMINYESTLNAISPANNGQLILKEHSSSNSGYILNNDASDMLPKSPPDNALQTNLINSTHSLPSLLPVTSGSHHHVSLRSSIGSESFQQSIDGEDEDMEDDEDEDDEEEDEEMNVISYQSSENIPPSMAHHYGSLIQDDEANNTNMIGNGSQTGGELTALVNHHQPQTNETSLFEMETFQEIM